MDTAEKQRRIDKIITSGTADNTQRTYEADLKYFWGWAQLSVGEDEHYPVSRELCEQFAMDHIEGLDPATDAALVASGVKAWIGRQKVSTIHRRIKALAWAHKIRNLESPTAAQSIRSVISAARRAESKQGIVTRRSQAITKPILLNMINRINVHTLQGKRDRALLAFGFFTGGRRRSEIAGAQMRFLSKSGGVYTYFLHRSKTDQSGKGAKKILRAPYSKWLAAWIGAACITDGYLFRTLKRNGTASEKPLRGRTVNQIVKRYIEATGKYDPANFSAHGLRRGFMTQCGRDGNISLGDAMALGGWSDVKTAMRYYEEGQLENNPATRI